MYHLKIQVYVIARIRSNTAPTPRQAIEAGDSRPRIVIQPPLLFSLLSPLSTASAVLILDAKEHSRPKFVRGQILIACEKNRCPIVFFASPIKETSKCDGDSEAAASDNADYACL